VSIRPSRSSSSEKSRITWSLPSFRERERQRWQGQRADGQPETSLRRSLQPALCLLLAVGRFPKALFDHFVGQLESFLFFYIFTKTATKELERNFSNWADELREIGTIVHPHLQRQKLNAFVADRLQTNMTAKQAELNDALRRLTLTSMQQYRIKYLLAKLTQFVDVAFRGLKTTGSLDEYKGLEIEHILPNNPTADLRKRFAETNQGSITTSTRSTRQLDSPGETDQHRGRKRFLCEEKGRVQKCKCYLTSSLAGLSEVGKNTTITRINQKLLVFDEWAAKDIDSRQTMLLGLVKEVWKTEPIGEE